MNSKEKPNTTAQAVDDGPPIPCGEPHPRYKGVTCEKTGRCWGTLPHMGIVTDPRQPHGYQRRWVYWGGASMEVDKNV